LIVFLIRFSKYCSSTPTKAYFKETGAPYPAKLFRVGKKTFWIIYTIDGMIVSLRRFWDCAREPATRGLR